MMSRSNFGYSPHVSRRLLNCGLAAFLFLVLWFSTLVNGFGVAQWENWINWQLDSESLVLTRVEADAQGADVPALGMLFEGNPMSTGEVSVDVYERISKGMFPFGPESEGIEYLTYTSNFGIQANLVSVAWREFGCGLSCLRLVNTGLYSLVAALVFLGILRLMSGPFAWVWIACVLCSPWLTMAARNLFWSPWLWFLPTLAALNLIAAKNKVQKYLAFFALVAAFALKFALTGYELFTSITILACSVPIFAAILKPRSSKSMSSALKASAGIAVSAGAGFLGVMVIHAVVVGGRLTDGLRILWVETILRRTWGNPETMDPIYAQALNSSPFTVLKRYMAPEWWFQSDLLALNFDNHGSVFGLSLGGTSFALVVFASVTVVALRYANGSAKWKRDSVLLLVSYASAASWFVAAKAHSYLHNHILFVLWYLLFVPTVMYVIVSFGNDACKYFRDSGVPHLSRTLISSVRPLRSGNGVKE
ncbi:MAG: hypothetical protein O2854_08130 [Chloroflexi bacterium]|nr:hypothetical protein [Chloroflexota bacterium]